MYFFKFVLCCFLIFLQTATPDLSVEQYNTLINNFIDKTNSYKYPTDARAFFNGTYDHDDCLIYGNYDFIIVGAGSSGTVLANRLSEVFGWRVLLLEAGGEENDFSDIPAMFDYLRLSDFNWGYKSVPQKNSLLGYVNNSEIIPRGKVLGGSSVMNAMMYVRGNKHDYDTWGEQNPGWSYSSVLPFFKKSENATLKPPQDHKYHGHHGPLHVQTIDTLTDLTQAFLDANEELDRKILDYNGKEQMGFSLIQLTSTNGRRDSGAKVFLKPIRNRKNLKIQTRAFVMKLLTYKKAVYGVKFMNKNKAYCAFTSKEVILSAGGINTPHLLMLSGIGPKKDLKKLGIKVIQDLPVGQNMWDHICLALIPFITNLNLKVETQTSLIQQYLNGKGFYTAADSIQDVGFTNLYSSNKNIPDIEYILRASYIPQVPYEYYKQTKNLGQDIYKEIIQKMEGKTVWQSYAVLLKPKSRGTIKLKSKDPFDFPLIDPNYFSDPNNSDLKTLIESIKDMIKISNTKSLQKFKSTMLKIDLPNCRNFDFGTDGHYGCLVKNLASTLHHFAGTAKMGPSDDKTSVVGPDLRVHGIFGLRVADCSVIPVTISGHTNSVAYMVGEKAGHIIKEQWLDF